MMNTIDEWYRLRGDTANETEVVTRLTDELEEFKGKKRAQKRLFDAMDRLVSQIFDQELLTNFTPDRRRQLESKQGSLKNNLRALRQSLE